MMYVCSVLGLLDCRIMDLMTMCVMSVWLRVITVVMVMLRKS